MIKEYFKKLRFDKNHHTELGDIRLTIGQQEEIIKMFKEALKKQREICATIQTADKEPPFRDLGFLPERFRDAIMDAPEPEL